MPRKRKDQVPALPGSQRFIFWFSQAAKELREDAGVNIQRVASYLDVDQRTITRFEKAENWPDDPDRLVAAYAAACDLNDPRDVYARALDRWHEYGVEPNLDGKQDGDVSGVQRYAQELAARRRRPRAPAVREGKPTAVPKRRASS